MTDKITVDVCVAELTKFTMRQIQEQHDDAGLNLLRLRRMLSDIEKDAQYAKTAKLKRQLAIKKLDADIARNDFIAVAKLRLQIADKKPVVKPTKKTDYASILALLLVVMFFVINPVLGILSVIGVGIWKNRKT